MSPPARRNAGASPAKKPRRSPARAAMPETRPPVAPRFHVGDRVCVRAADPPGHVRTPYYTRGHCGVVEANAGSFANPEELAYGRSGEPPIPLYHVRFQQRELWPDYAGAAGDSIVVDIFEHWLEPAPATRRSRAGANARECPAPASDEHVRRPRRTKR